MSTSHRVMKHSHRTIDNPPLALEPKLVFPSIVISVLPIGFERHMSVDLYIAAVKAPLTIKCLLTISERGMVFFE